MTKQEYLAELIARVEDGRFPAVENDRCSYRTADGRACAAGVLIPDDEYTPDFEDITYLEKLECYTDTARLIGERLHNAVKLPEGVTPEMVRECQGAHDTFSVDKDKTRFVERVTKCLS